MKWCNFPLADIMGLLIIGSWPQMRACWTFYRRETNLLILCNDRLDISYVIPKSHFHEVTVHKKGAGRHEGLAHGMRKIRVQTLLEQ
jgi:hypothetical protein